jgi:hypothetical protein
VCDDDFRTLGAKLQGRAAPKAAGRPNDHNNEVFQALGAVGHSRFSSKETGTA